MNQKQNHTDVVIVGHPNAGKTTILNQITSSKYSTGNWDGVTVVANKAMLNDITFTDLPGFEYIADPNKQVVSSDKKAALDFLKQNTIKLFIYVIDINRIQGGIECLQQLLQTYSDIPVLVVINKKDLASRTGLEIDIHYLTEVLKCDVLYISANNNTDINNLKKIISRKFRKDNEYTHKYANNIISSAAEITKNAVTKKTKVRMGCSDIIDNVLLNRWLGFPLFIIMMYAMFVLTVQLTGVLQEVFEFGAQVFIANTITAIASSMEAPWWLISVCYRGIGMGVSTIGSFIPLIAVLYLCMGIMEESGYLSRASIAVDHIMGKFGLPGKAAIPLILGFGCNVPSIVAARSLDGYKERVSTIMMMPFMVCGARFAVFIVFCTALFTEYTATYIFILYMTGIFFAALTAMGLKYTLSLNTIGRNMILQLPEYSIPNIKRLSLKIWHRLKSFVKGIGKVIIFTCIALYILSSINLSTLSTTTPAESTLATIGKASTILTNPLGIGEDNWEAAVSLLTGIIAKEVVVGTLSTLYGIAEDDDLNELYIATKKKSAWQWWLDKLYEYYQDVILQNGQEEDEDPVLEAKLQKKFSDHSAAFAYLLFVLLYFPCISVFAVTWKEIGLKYAVLSALWPTALAYIVALVFYQLSNIFKSLSFEYYAIFSSSLLGMLVVVGGLILCLIMLLKVMRKGDISLG